MASVKRTATNFNTTGTKVQKKSTGKRRFHKKSRKGCMTCKRRRVKCDETRDVCKNCDRMGIQCIYQQPEDVAADKDSAPVETNDNRQHQHQHQQQQQQQQNLLQPQSNFDLKLSVGSQASESVKVTSVKMEKVSTGPNMHQLPEITTPLPLPGISSLSLPGLSPMSPNAMFSQLPQTQMNMGVGSPFSGMTGLVNAAVSMANQNLHSIPSINHHMMSNPEKRPSPPLSSSASSSMGPNLESLTGSISSPGNNFNVQMAQQFLSGMAPDKQIKLIQQFAALPQDKQQQLYQTMPTSINGDMLGKMFSNSTDPLSGLIGEMLPTRPDVKREGKTPTPQELQQQYSKPTDTGPSISPDNIKSPMPSLSQTSTSGDLNLLDLRLMYHYTTKVWPTITAAGISDSKIWSDDIPMLAFKYPFLMHSVLAFSATHLSRSERGLDQYVTCHRADALRLLRDAVLEMSPENTDALVASALILIMDSLANASLPSSTSVKALPPSAWIFHVKGAATILTAVWPLSEKSRFYKFISVDLGDLGEIGYDLISGELSNTSDDSNSRSDSLSNQSNTINYSSTTEFDETDKHIKKSSRTIHINPDLTTLANMIEESCSKSTSIKYSSIQCFDDEISDIFPIALNSPYFPTLAYMTKLYQERKKSDFILRIFAFPALLDKRFLGLLINCDLTAMRIMKCYYTLLRNFTEEMKEKVWFLEGVSSVLPVDVDQYSGGGGMHMMLDFLGGPSTIDDDGNGENYVAKSAAQSGLLDTNNLPSASMNDSLRLDGDVDSQSGFLGV